MLSNHYNPTRPEYYRQLDRASKSGGDLLPFLRYAVQGVVDGLREQLEFAWSQQWDITWRNYVHELFQHRASASDLRQRQLALDLGMQPEWVPLAQLSELTPRLAKAYANKTSKTLQRDFNVLAGMELIVRETKRVRARRELIFGFHFTRRPQSPRRERNGDEKTRDILGDLCGLGVMASGD